MYSRKPFKIGGGASVLKSIIRYSFILLYSSSLPSYSNNTYTHCVIYIITKINHPIYYHAVSVFPFFWYFRLNVPFLCFSFQAFLPDVLCPVRSCVDMYIFFSTAHGSMYEGLRKRSRVEKHFWKGG